MVDDEFSVFPCVRVPAESARDAECVDLDSAPERRLGPACSARESAELFRSDVHVTLHLHGVARGDGWASSVTLATSTGSMN